jgi:hypothetical protein
MTLIMDQVTVSLYGFLDFYIEIQLNQKTLTSETASVVRVGVADPDQ